jgi:hypothetical protein
MHEYGSAFDGCGAVLLGMLFIIIVLVLAAI